LTRFHKRTEVYKPSGRNKGAKKLVHMQLSKSVTVSGEDIPCLTFREWFYCWVPL